MRIGIMQPYLFPYIGYFQLINYVDKWVIFDDIQYISKGWINRNRILHPDIKKEWQYFTIPVKKHSREIKIMDVEINNDIQWRDELLGKLTQYKKKAPFYNETKEFLGDCLSADFSNLCKLNESTLKNTCDYLNIPFDYSIFSQMKINTSNVEHSGQWAKEIAHATGADEYVNPADGHKLFNESEFIDIGIQLKFLQSKLSPYVQRRGSFVPGLSIIDVMMWNDVSAISELLEDFLVFTKSELTREGL